MSKTSDSKGAVAGYFRDTASDLARGRNGCSKPSPSPGKRESASDYPGAREAAFMPDVPVPLKSSRCAALHDTGISADSVSGSHSPEARQEGPLSGLDDLIRQPHEPFVHLDRSLLVRLKLAHRNGEPIAVLCATDEIRCGGVHLLLPCALGLKPETAVDMELFIPSSSDPVAASGVVRKVGRLKGEDVSRYRVEVEFRRLTGQAQGRIAAFVQEARMDERRALA